jgi:hypothetical protein
MFQWIYLMSARNGYKINVKVIFTGVLLGVLPSISIACKFVFDKNLILATMSLWPIIASILVLTALLLQQKYKTTDSSEAKLTKAI